jgi:DNA polymerase-3 subunit alpha
MITQYNTQNIKELDIVDDVDIVGVVSAYKEFITKRGDKMAYATIEDMSGSVETIVFPDLLLKSPDILKEDKPLIINGTVEKSEEGNAKIRIKNITLLEDITCDMGKIVKIKINCEVFPKDGLRLLKDILFGLKGKSKVSIELGLNGENKLLNIQDLYVDHNKMDILNKHFTDGITFEVEDEILS